MSSFKIMPDTFSNNYSAAAEALRDVYLRSHRALDRLLAEQGATLARIKIMRFIHCGGNVRATDLAAAFGFAPRTITEAIDGLEREGLVERCTDGNDRRVKYLGLTKQGEKVLSASEPIRQQFGDQLFAALNEKELAQLTKLLRRLADRLAEMDE